MKSVLESIMKSHIDRIFVYGTLKKGQLRESMWPYRPTHIVGAKVQGNLYDLGTYPAMTHGHDWIAGDVWRFAIEQIPATLRVLDEIEGHRDRPDDLYKRVVIECETEDDDVVVAYSYHYARDLSTNVQVLADEDGLCRWPKK